MDKTDEIHEDTHCGGFRTDPDSYQPTGEEKLLSKVIRHTRKKRGMTLRDVADKVGCTPPEISAWERAAAPLPNGHIWDRIVDVLDI